MTNSPSIVPSQELVQQWLTEFYDTTTSPEDAAINLAARAAQWGADQELQECINFVYDNELCDPNFYNDLRAARRPKPPSLKEQALADFNWLVGRTLGRPEFDERSNRIRHALETLPND